MADVGLFLSPHRRWRVVLTARPARAAARPPGDALRPPAPDRSRRSSRPRRAIDRRLDRRRPAGIAGPQSSSILAALGAALVARDAGEPVASAQRRPRRGGGGARGAEHRARRDRPGARRACARRTRPCAGPRSTCGWSSRRRSTASSSSTRDGSILPGERRLLRDGRPATGPRSRAQPWTALAAVGRRAPTSFVDAAARRGRRTVQRHRRPAAVPGVARLEGPDDAAAARCC